MMVVSMSSDLRSRLLGRGAIPAARHGGQFHRRFGIANAARAPGLDYAISPRPYTTDETACCLSNRRRGVAGESAAATSARFPFAAGKHHGEASPDARHSSSHIAAPTI